jgi:hypothetical protein
MAVGDPGDPDPDYLDPDLVQPAKYSFGKAAGVVAWTAVVMHGFYRGSPKQIYTGAAAALLCFNVDLSWWSRTLQEFTARWFSLTFEYYNMTPIAAGDIQVLPKPDPSVVGQGDLAINDVQLVRTEVLRLENETVVSFLLNITPCFDSDSFSTATFIKRTGRFEDLPVSLIHEASHFWAGRTHTAVNYAISVRHFSGLLKATTMTAQQQAIALAYCPLIAFKHHLHVYVTTDENLRTYRHHLKIANSKRRLKVLGYVAAACAALGVVVGVCKWGGRVTATCRGYLSSCDPKDSGDSGSNVRSQSAPASVFGDTLVSLGSSAVQMADESLPAIVEVAESALVQSGPFIRAFTPTHLQDMGVSLEDAWTHAGIAQELDMSGLPGVDAFIEDKVVHILRTPIFISHYVKTVLIAPVVEEVLRMFWPKTVTAALIALETRKYGQPATAALHTAMMVNMLTSKNKLVTLCNNIMLHATYNFSALITSAITLTGAYEYRIGEIAMEYMYEPVVATMGLRDIVSEILRQRVRRPRLTYYGAVRAIQATYPSYAEQPCNLPPARRKPGATLRGPYPMKEETDTKIRMHSFGIGDEAYRPVFMQRRGPRRR